jgi:hypothetical protein
MREPHEARRTFSAADWARLIQSEYEEMPDLNLTPAQMQRLWGIGPNTCRAVIELLIARNALKLTLAGSYARHRANC